MTVSAVTLRLRECLRLTFSLTPIEAVNSCGRQATQVMMTKNSLATMTSSAAGAAKPSVWDNACAESFFGTLKQKLTTHKTYATREDATKNIFEYIEVLYNNKRRHSTLGSPCVPRNRTPVEFEAHISSIGGVCETRARS